MEGYHPGALPRQQAKTHLQSVKGLQPEARASGLTRIRRPKKCSQGIQPGGRNLCTTPLPSSKSPVFPRKECMPLSGTSFLMLLHRTPLGELALVASGAYACKSYKTVTNGKRVRKQTPPLEHRERQQPLCERNPSAKHHRCSPRSRLLAEHIKG